MREEIIEVIEEQGFYVTKTDGGYELQQSTPAGEDWNIYVTDEENLLKYLYEYDADDDLEMWAPHAGKNGTPSIRLLVQDADWKQEQVDELYNAITKGTQ